MAVLKQPSQACRIGIGFDAHEFCKGRKLMLGGTHIPYPQGLAGHSDADALLHAVTDALLGALALPDIGRQFPDTDPRYKDADSRVLLGKVMKRVSARGYQVANLDCVVVCDRPKLAPYADAIRSRIAGLLGVNPDRVGLKAKTCEGTLLAIPGKSIAAFVTVLLARTGRRSAFGQVKSRRSKVDSRQT
jgi:2-C-methyl-D-erythritol 2,4-cyclodiphosphate synthase